MLLCATGLSSFNCVVFEHSVSESNKLMSWTGKTTLFDVQINRFVEHEINPSINQLVFLSFKILRFAYHCMSRWKNTKLVSYYLGFCTEGFILIP